MKDITAYTTAKTFVPGWVSHFGILVVIYTDRGKQFKSDQFNQQMKLLGSRRIKTNAYHLEAIGRVKQFHRLLKSPLKARMNQSSWLEHPPLVLLGLQTIQSKKISNAHLLRWYKTLHSDFWRVLEPGGMTQGCWCQLRNMNAGPSQHSRQADSIDCHQAKTHQI